MKNNHFKGLVAAPFTPMDDTGQINPEMIPALAAHLKMNGVAGAFINGSTGEGVSLTYDEKVSLMEAWAKEQTSDFKVIALIGTNSLEEGKNTVREIDRLRLWAGAILPPFYFRIDRAHQLAEYCVALGSAAPELRMYYYHIPALTGVDLPMIDFLEAIDDRMPQFAGIKYTAPDLMDFRQCQLFREGAYDILWGIDEYLLGALAMGARAGVGSTYNYAAPVYHRLIQAFEKGDMDEARKWQRISIRIVEILRKHGGIPAGKFFMKYIGLDCGEFRLPVGEAEDYDAFLVALDQMEFLKWNDLPDTPEKTMSYDR